MNYLQRIADQLNAAADELEKHCPDPTVSLEHHWAAHLREDAKSFRLLAEAMREPVAP